MVVVELIFPSGRYHATPWGAHVNEGLVEYPPSPWRLLRSLIAAWHCKLRPPQAAAAGEEQRVLGSLLISLAGELPCYRLPPALAAHTRHYMPPFKGKTTKVLDAFLDLGRDAVLQIAWPGVLLDDQQASLFGRLTRVLGFLGRAESWVSAALLCNDDANGAGPWNAVALRAGEVVPPGHQVIRLLAPMKPADFEIWRTGELERRTREILAADRARAAARRGTPGRSRMSAKKKAKIEGSLPRSVPEVLEVETGTMRKEGWNRPPGSRWVDYVRPAEITAASPDTIVPGRAAARPTAARYVVASQAPPRLTEAVAVAERMRMALQAHSDGAGVFSGKSADGKPLRGHRHAFILCEAAGHHGRISHVTIHASMGFNEQARATLGRLVKVWGHGGHDLQLVLTGIGRPEDFAGRRVEAGQCPLLDVSRMWISYTPFVPTRHAKATRAGRPKLDAGGLQVGSPEHDLRRLLADRFAEPVRVESVRETRLGGRPTRWSAFRTARVRGGGRRSMAIGYGFRVEFSEPVRGPIAVGYGAHFGLGAFKPDLDRRRSS